MCCIQEQDSAAWTLVSASPQLQLHGAASLLQVVCVIQWPFTEVLGTLRYLLTNPRTVE